MQAQRAAVTGLYRDRILVKQGQRMIPILTADVAYFFTKEKINFLLTKDNHRYPIDFTMEELENPLDPKHFFRANRQYILSYSSVAKVLQGYNSKLRISLSPPVAEEVIISRDKAMDFRQWLGE